jgi:aspartyl protease family protein
MGTPDNRRPSAQREVQNPVVRPSAPPPSFPDTNVVITRRGPSPFLRIVMFGSWLLIFMLLVALLKGMNEWRLHKVKEQVRLMKPQPPAPAVMHAPDSTAAEPPPPEPATAPALTDEASAPAEPPPVAPSPPQPAEEAPQKPATQLAELIISPASNGNYYVKGLINQQEVTFVIDTGASAVSIPDKLRWQLGLTRGRYLQGATANGVAGMYETRIKQLSVGPLRFKDVQAVLYPNAPDDMILLGMTALREVRMEQQNGQMILQQVLKPDSGPAATNTARPVPLKKSVSECMGSDKVVNARVLKCMQGMEEEPEGSGE